MATPRHLARAPITETLSDVRPVGTAPQVEQLRQALERELGAGCAVGKVAPWLGLG